MKAGANYSDIAKIRKNAAAGHSAEDIANGLSLPLACVESYMPAKPVEEDKPKRKRRTKEEIAADEAAAEAEE